MKDNIIEIENLRFTYEIAEDGNTVPAETIKGLSLSFERGSFTAVAGPNGSGKSTLSKLMNALYVPTSGRILVDGMDTADENNTWEIRKRVGMVFQNPDNQLVSSVVEDDVAFGPENLGVPSDEIRQRVDDALNAVSMYEFRKKGPHLLSGGQKQRVAIAGVLAMLPECIIFDEPTAMLDPSGRAEIMEIIEKLHESGKTIILITHFMEEAARADRMVVLQNGVIAADGTPREVFSDVEKLKQMHLKLPETVELADRLRSHGIALSEDILTEEELIKALCALK